MKKDLFNKKFFWCVLIISLLINVLPIVIFREKAGITGSSFIAIIFLVLVLINGFAACAGKDARIFAFSRYSRTSRFWRYNRPTKADMKEFWMAATIYFFVIPFYLPIIFFSTSIADSAWCLLLLLIPNFTYIGIEIYKMSRKAKTEKLRQEQLEKERLEQEKREELGRWK